MKFTLAWLEEHLATDQPLDAIVDRLTMIGGRPLTLSVSKGLCVSAV